MTEAREKIYVWLYIGTYIYGFDSFLFLFFVFQYGMNNMNKFVVQKSIPFQM